MKRFLIHTMGCKSNQFESAIIKENLEQNGLIESKNAENADYYILNSCSVTHKSDNEALYLLRSLKHKNPNIINIITGCFAQIEKDKLLNEDYIDLVVGNDEKLKIYDAIKKFETAQEKYFMSDIMLQKTFNYTRLIDTTKTRASLKIQDGCDNRCSYCIIPYARGNSRSAKPDFIIDEINSLVTKGFNEVVFTGIHIGLWGKEFGLNLLDLLKEVEEKTNLTRYRLGSLYPNEINDEMLDFLVQSKKFCPHFHLSLQSACNKTLKAMNRQYLVEDYLALIDKINNKFHLPFIGSDIITGFAGETDEDFEITKENLEKSGLSQIHTFPYSIRQGTTGAEMNNQVDEKIKDARATVIKNISNIKYKEFISKNIGEKTELLIEKHPDKNTGFIKGVTRNYLTVILDKKDLSLTNTIQTAKIIDYRNGKIYGEIL